jgi:phospholipid/cholesterol/gamma-HCH transport system substrate-binding protein
VVTRRMEITVGATVLAALAILIFGIIWLREVSLTRDTRVYRVSFPQAGGLAASDEVHVNGLRRGEVKKMELVGDHVEVDLQLAKDIVLTTDSRVAIRNVGIMGERIIAVDLKTTGRPYREDELVQGSYELGLGEIMGQLGTTVDAVTAVSAQLQELANAMSGEGRLQATIQNFTTTSEELRLTVSENRAMLRSTLSNFAEASRTARSLTTGREAELRKSLDHFSNAAERLDRISVKLDSLSTSINAVASRVEGGQGTLGKLVQDEKLYAELNASVRSIQQLIADVKQNPKKYFKFSVF